MHQEASHNNFAVKFDDSRWQQKPEPRFKLAEFAARWSESNLDEKLESVMEIEAVGSSSPRKIQPKTEKTELNVPKTKWRPNSEGNIPTNVEKESQSMKPEIPIGIQGGDISSRSRSRSGPKTEKEN